MDNFDKIIIALAYLINVLSTLIPDISTIIANYIYIYILYSILGRSFSRRVFNIKSINVILRLTMKKFTIQCINTVCIVLS